MRTKIVWMHVLCMLVAGGTVSTQAAQRIWDGGGTNGSWSEPVNWVGDQAPLAGDDLVFPAGAAQLVNSNNYPAGKSFNSIALSGVNYTISGASIVLNAGIDATNAPGQNWVFIPVTLGSNQTVTTSGMLGVNLYLDGSLALGSHDLTFDGWGYAQVGGAISGTGGLVKTGIGSVSLYASNSFSGAVQIVEGGVGVYNTDALGSINTGTTIGSAGELGLAIIQPLREPLQVEGTLSAGPNVVSVAGPIVLAGTNAVLRADGAGSLTVNSVLAGAGGFSKEGTGLVTLNSNNTYSGTTTVSRGTLLVNGSQSGNPVVLAGGTLGGSGTVGPISAAASVLSALAPGAGSGILTCSNLALNAFTTVQVEVNGAAAGAGYDQLNVHGTVDLGGAGLTVTLGFQPALGQAFVIVNNDGAEPVTGTFAGLPEGALITSFENTFSISYAGGSGNDVVLTTVGVPVGSIWTGAGTGGNWTTADNWLSHAAPPVGQDLVFPSGAAGLINTNNYPAGTTFNSIRISGTNYTLYGSNLVLNAGLTITGVGYNEVDCGILLASNQTFTLTSPLAQAGVYNVINAQGKDLTFDGGGGWSVTKQLAGISSLVKTGAGRVSLYASNEISGPVDVQQGALQINNLSGLGSASSGTTVAPGARLELNTYGTMAEPLTLGGNLLSGGLSLRTLTGPITLTASNVTIWGISALVINSVISGTGGLVKTFSDDLTLNGNNTYSGTTTISNGTVFVNGTQPYSDVILAGGTLGGSGTVGRITSADGGFVAPGNHGPGMLSSSNVFFNMDTTLALQLNGTAAGVDYDQLRVHGTVTLNLATLSLTLGFTPAVGDTFLILNNEGPFVVGGQFMGLAEGAILNVNGLSFQISYSGGTGNDIVLTRISPPSAIQSVSRLGGGQIQLVGSGALSGFSYGIEAASNLTPLVQWLNIGAATAGLGGAFSFVDTNAPLLPMRFYRAVSP